MKKIMFVTGSMGRGGAERVISILSRHYIDIGWDVSIAMLLHENIKYELSSQIKVLNCSSSRGIKKSFVEVIKKFRSCVKEVQPDVIVCFMAQNILLSSIAIKNMNIPFIVSERIDPASVKRNVFFRCAINRIYEKTDLVIFQTKRAQNYYNEKIKNNSCIIYNPIKLYAERNINIKHKIVSVGRLVNQKNHKMLINAFYEIHLKYPNYSLYIYGEGPLRNILDNLIKEKHMEEYVFLPGSVPDVHEKISDAEIFVLSSNFEGLSNALMEAMLMGLPVISTDCAGSDEMIKDGINGILIPIGDEKALVKSMEKLILDEKLRTKISKNARETMISCEENNIISKWDQAIYNVINK